MSPPKRVHKRRKPRPDRKPGPSPDRLWGLDDVAAYVSASRRTATRLRSKLPPPVLMVGISPRWLPSTILEWVLNGGRS